MLAMDLFYTPPPISRKRYPGLGRCAGSKTFGLSRVACSASAASAGRTNGTPKFQNLPVEVSTEVDSHKARKPAPEISGTSDLVLAWALAGTKASWGSIARRLEKLALAVTGSDPEFAEDLQLLAAIARRHGGMK